MAPPRSSLSSLVSVVVARNWEGGIDSIHLEKTLEELEFLNCPSFFREK
jgi:hypothetical protein